MIIKLFCQNGASTAMLAEAIRKVASKKDIDASVDAYPVSTLEKNIVGADIVLLAPQIKFKKAQIEQAHPEYKYYLIDTLDYGLMKGEKILDDVLKMLEK